MRFISTKAMVFSLLLAACVCRPALASDQVQAGSTAAGGWFMPTPLQRVYQALADHNMLLAWQELQVVLQQSTEPVTPDLWQPVFQQLINQSDCGRRLTEYPGALSDWVDQPRISLSIQDKVNLSQRVYQLKLSIDGAGHAMEVSLTDSRGNQWLSGASSTPVEGYSELESREWFQSVPDGYYQLSVGEKHYPLILTSLQETERASAIQLQQAEKSTAGVFVFSPDLFADRNACQRQRLQWQWFDSDYQLASPAETLVLDAQGHGVPPRDKPDNANWLSAVVADSYFQGAIKIENVHRLTVPVRYMLTD
ncbi:DUF2861 family protein [Photobacterium sp. WH24]|uniref:DUF2861 family protein n=1 Tax=Photobacterium arenosum TaxID=2774143 RepID=A0ABR9BFQ3_9GAMM|nr:DUF2861 family protein [Photobacterium arenosum]MBD8511397.1 DUF2861 family protein [Photobacterium arenosum]MBV7263054.1 DUF2861 family protein [Photobacterium sp. WH24]